MKVNIPSSNLIACMCEGGAEMSIMDILLDHNLLIFTREQLLEERVLPRVGAKEFEKRYLRRDYETQITILRVIDSRSEGFNLSEVYRRQVDIITVITPPEIEILVIVSKGKYDDFCRSGVKKPSEYCKNNLKIKNVKSQHFVNQYFASPEFLIETIKEYHRLHRLNSDETSLYDLLRNK